MWNIDDVQELSDLLCDAKDWARRGVLTPSSLALYIQHYTSGTPYVRAMEFRMFQATLDEELLETQIKLCKSLYAAVEVSQGSGLEIGNFIATVSRSIRRRDMLLASQDLLNGLGMADTAPLWERGKLGCPDWNDDMYQSHGGVQIYRDDCRAWERHVRAFPLIPAVIAGTPVGDYAVSQP